MHTAEPDGWFVQQDKQHPPSLAPDSYLGGVFGFIFLFFPPHCSSMILCISGGVYYIFMNKSFHEQVACGAVTLFRLQKLYGEIDECTQEI